MIEAKITIAPPVFSLELNGHAGYNPGNDVVCAAVSAIVYTVAGWVENHRDDLTRVDKHLYSSGKTDILVSGNDKAQAVFEAAAIGLLQIEVRYPCYLRVKMLD